MHRVRFVFLAVMATALVTLAPGAQAASSFADAAFQSQWQAGEAVTPNFWGPLNTAKAGQQEPYKEASGGQRVVQYFDKGRMELTNGKVTNGLLATEIVTGRVQTGDSTFENRPPPTIAIAGDADNPAPTYAGLAGKGAALLQATNSTPGAPVNTFIAPNGNLGGADSPGSDPAMQIGAYDAPTQHNVAAAFADYRGKAGLATIGYAISDPFRSTVKVGGASKDVMVQVFERRALTYTASNPDAFKVEMGNIGQHYFSWRYSGGAPPPSTTTPDVPTVDIQSAVAFRYPDTWKVDETNTDPTRVVIIGPSPSLKFFVQNFEQTDPIATVLAAQIQGAHKLAAGGITSEATTDRTLGGEPGKVYTFSGTRTDGSPVSGLIAVVFHKGREYDLIFLANAATLPNNDDITGILATVTFQS